MRLLFSNKFTTALLVLSSLVGFLHAQNSKVTSQNEATINEDTEILLEQLLQLNPGWANRLPNFDVLSTQTTTIDQEVALIRTHLRLAIDQLQKADVSHLSSAQLNQRSQNISHLETYMTDGVFPQNFFVPDRCPVFIDPWGTRCAVGHLIASSGHEDLAQAINSEHQLDRLRDIKTPGLSEWQLASGLSLDELALIQPSYHSQLLIYPKEIEALINGDSSQVRAAIETGELSVDARCGGKTLLHFAAAAGDLKLAKLLIAKGADLHAVSEIEVKRVNPVTAAEREAASKNPFSGPRSSQTKYEVRWNKPTLITRYPGRHAGIGNAGNVLTTLRGRDTAGILADIANTVTDKDALYYATSKYGMSSGYITPPPPPSPPSAGDETQDDSDSAKVSSVVSQPLTIVDVRKQWDQDRTGVAKLLIEHGLKLPPQDTSNVRNPDEAFWGFRGGHVR